MWDRCHWRLLYNVGLTNSTVRTYLSGLKEGSTILTLLDAMNTDEHIYDFASKCGSWDWAGIAIILVCGRFLL